MSMRVHDLAAEFGVASDELMTLLREMDIFVRSHLSALEEDKVSRVRARWEREKRKEKAPAPNKPLSEDTFSIKNLGVEEDTLVSDNIKKKDYRYSKGNLIPIAEPNNPPK